MNTFAEYIHSDSNVEKRREICQVSYIWTNIKRVPVHGYISM